MNSIFFSLVLFLSGSSPNFLANHPVAHGKANPGETEFKLYNEINWADSKPDFVVFNDAVLGFRRLQDSLSLFKKPLLTIIDFSKPSNDQRLWVINMETKRLLIHSLVAHGRNSGELMAAHFSNKINSLQSSLGFYRTGVAYQGKHGLSLKLHGLEKGINDQAEKRAIVIHGAEYVSEIFVKRNGRLGRSQGCPGR